MKQLLSQTFDVVQSRTVASQDAPANTEQRYVIEEDFGYLFNFVAKLFSRRLAGCVAQHGIGFGQWPVLLFLWANDGMTQTELSRHVLIDDATMVRTIDRMEREELVQRVRNPNDRRQHNIFLTDRGRALRDELIPCALMANTTLLGILSDDEHVQLRELLRRVITAQEPQLTCKTTESITCTGEDQAGCSNP